jgi:rod shape-determining protein MreD
MNARMPTPEGVIRNPVSGGLILSTLFAALCLNLVPWHGPALLARPDLLLLMLIYWCMHEPRSVGAASAFLGGLVMDVAESAILGQNALTYSLAAYLAISMRLRVLRFGFWAQALHVVAILLLVQLLQLLENFLIGVPLPSSLYFGRSVFGAVLWPFISWLLELHRLQPRREEIAR